MKILILSTFDLKGGAAKAAFRLFESLLKFPGVEIKMLVKEKSSNNSYVIFQDSIFSKYFASIMQAFDNLLLIFYPKRSRALFSSAFVSQDSILEIINEFRPDVINIHWINNGFLSLQQISKFPNIPIVFSMHDMWITTGGCHYSLDCLKFQNKCFSCEQLNSRSHYDLSTFNFNRKVKLIEKSKREISFIGLSTWISELAKKSKIVGERVVVNLPNPINTEFYKPFNKKYCRELLGVDCSKKILLYGAVNATTNKIKGFEHLKNAFNSIDSNEHLLVVFGNSEEDFELDCDIEVLKLGFIHDELTMRALYNAADLFLLPSIQENLSNSIMESLSCGVPVVAFDIGGNSDMVKHRVTGYLAKPFDSLDFANGINYVLENSQLSSQARDFVVNHFDYSVVSKKYFDYFKSIIKNK
jgi:glycosyltransferase involved in cell wall biosynthesis